MPENTRLSTRTESGPIRARWLSLVSLIALAIPAGACSSRSNDLDVHNEPVVASGPCEQPDARSCSGRTPVLCASNEEGALEWTPEPECQPPTICLEGQCQACEANCPNVGQRKCEGLQLMECQQDSRGCTRFEPVGNICGTACSPDKGCVETCDAKIGCLAIGTSRCNGPQPETCETVGGCVQWNSKGSPCQAGTTCSAGVCKQDCDASKKCQTVGSSGCLGDQPVVCSQGEGGCLVYQNVGAKCGTGLCQDGKCVAECVSECTLDAVRCSSDQPQICRNKGTASKPCYKWDLNGGACAPGKCVQSTGSCCVPQSDTQCVGNDVHWVDSCGGVEGVKQPCGSSPTYGSPYCDGSSVVRSVNTPTCAGKSCSSSSSTETVQYCGSTPSYGNPYCNGNTVVRSVSTPSCSGGSCTSSSSTETVQNCGSTPTYGSSYCSGGNVVRNVSTPACSGGSCSSSSVTETVQTCSCGCSSASCLQCCSASSYWTANVGSETDNIGKQATTTISVSVTFEVREGSGGALEMRACKPSGTFSSDIWIGVRDANGGNAYRNVQMTAAGQGCTAWLGLMSSTGYSSGQKFGGVWYVVSPASSHSEWTEGCSSSSSAGGTCWNGVSITLTRTCK